MHKVVNIDQSPIGRNSRSNPATYVGFYDTIRDLFTQAPLSVERDYKPGRFSFNVKGGRCEECQGEGVITTQLYFMPDVEVTCGACKGARFNAETLEVTLRGKTIDDVLNMSVEEGVTFFAERAGGAEKIEVLNELGLGYLTLGQSSTTLSGGEAQRIKIATELSTLQRSKHTLYILDEPTTGLHLADVERLLASLNRLVDAGHTVLLIEHHMDVIKTADHVIDLGPEGGHARRRVVVTRHAGNRRRVQGVTYGAVSEAPAWLTEIEENGGSRKRRGRRQRADSRRSGENGDETEQLKLVLFFEAIGIDYSFDPVFEHLLIEVDQQPDGLLGEAKIRQQLRLVYEVKLLDALQFDDDTVVDEHVDPVHVLDPRAVVNDCHWHVAPDGMPAQVELDLDADRIRPFQKA